MDAEKYLREVVGRDNEFLFGLVHVDIVKHSQWKGTDREKAGTKASLEHLINLQLAGQQAFSMPWAGDGGTFVFDISQGCDELLTFADKVRQLIPLFNRSRFTMNYLRDGQDVVVRIICHAGQILNHDNTPGQLQGEALNNIYKLAREIERPGYVVLSEAVYRRISPDIQSRCQKIKEVHQGFGKVYILDSVISLSSIQYNDRRSDTFRDWIDESCKSGKYNELLYFGYTNELLQRYLANNLNNVTIRILARNWITERKEEVVFNNALYGDKNGNSKDTKPRKWEKSQDIENMARKTDQDHQHREQPIDVRYYDHTPVFNGAVLLGEGVPPRAYIGIIRWEKPPVEGGSPYKLEEWPALILDGHDNIQLQYIENIRSRFEEYWDNGLTYEDVKVEDEIAQANDPVVIGKIWKLDKKQDYKIVYTRRKMPGRNTPMVAYEDVMSFQLVIDLLKDYEVQVDLDSFVLPEEADYSYYPEELLKSLAEWEGHVVLICARSLASELLEYLNEEGAPFDFVEVGGKQEIHHKYRQDHIYKSPSHLEKPETRDYALIARYQRRERPDRYGYIIAGIRAMGTWGAASYFTNKKEIKRLSELEDTDGQFMAIIETEYDDHHYKLEKYRLRYPPEKFNQ